MARYQALRPLYEFGKAGDALGMLVDIADQLLEISLGCVGRHLHR